MLVAVGSDDVIGGKAAEGVDRIHRVGFIVKNLEDDLLTVEAARRVAPFCPGLITVDRVLAGGGEAAAHRRDDADLEFALLRDSCRAEECGGRQSGTAAQEKSTPHGHSSLAYGRL